MIILQLLLLFLPFLFTIFFYYYKKYLRFRTEVDVISGPPVSSLLLGNLNLFRPCSGTQFPASSQSPPQPTNTSKSVISPSKAAYIREFYRTFARLYQKYRSEGVFRLWMGPRQVVYVLTDVQSAECLLTSSANVNKGSEYQFMASWLGEGVFLLNDDAWRQRRKLLAPAFHHRTLTEFLPIFAKHSRRLVKTLENSLKTSQNSGFISDIRHPFEDCMLDIVKETSLGVDDHNSENSSEISSEYRNSLKMAIITSINRVRHPHHWFDWLFQWTTAGKKFFAYRKFLDDYANKIIHQRLEYFRSQSSLIKPTKLIDILLQKYLLQSQNFKKNSKNFLTLKSIRHEISTFIFGGHDTTAEVAIYAVLLIGHHLEVQNQIVGELKEVLGNKNEEEILNLEDLKRLRYLEAAIREVMRLHPPGQIIGRKISEDLELPNGKKLLAGSNCYIPLLYNHRDDRYYNEPDSFKPERWWRPTSEKGVDIEKGAHQSSPPFAFLTFSAGLRSCIGQKYAFLELKYVLAEILRRFEITSVTKVEDIVIGIGPVVTPLTEIGVRLTRRNFC